MNLDNSLQYGLNKNGRDQKTLGETMEKMTAGQACKFVLDRQVHHLAGVDMADYIRVLMEGKEEYVVLLTFHPEEGQTLSDAIRQNLPEIRTQSAEATSMLMMLYKGADSELMMADIDELSWFVDSVNAGGLNFAWGIESTGSTEYKMQICIFMVK